MFFLLTQKTLMKCFKASKHLIFIKSRYRLRLSIYLYIKKIIELSSLIKYYINLIMFQESVTWEKIRAYYSQLVALVKEVDSKFCYLVLLSFFTNIFFICVQFFYTLK